jgi:hypothetical protein
MNTKLLKNVGVEEGCEVGIEEGKDDGNELG